MIPDWLDLARGRERSGCSADAGIVADQVVEVDVVHSAFDASDRQPSSAVWVNVTDSQLGSVLGATVME